MSDLAFARGDRPLSTAAGSLIPALEGTLVIAVVCVTVMSAVLPSTASIGPLGVGAIGIVLIWLLGIMTLNRTRARADLAAGQPVLPAEGRSNAWIGCVGLLMTAAFVSGIVLRPQRRHLGLGLDSWIALLVYALGVWGLLVVSG